MTVGPVSQAAVEVLATSRAEGPPESAGSRTTPAGDAPRAGWASSRLRCCGVQRWLLAASRDRRSSFSTSTGDQRAPRKQARNRPM